jgi:hypothetical protein
MIELEMLSAISNQLMAVTVLLILILVVLVLKK